MLHWDGVNTHPLIMILLACNADGTNKLQPLVIWNSKNPHCFKNGTKYVAKKKKKKKKPLNKPTLFTN
jgi:hypothetical protein